MSFSKFLAFSAISLSLACAPALLAADQPPELQGGGFDAGSMFPYVGASYCDQQSEEKLKIFFEPRVDKFVGAPRILSQVLESINVCIATKAAQEPGVAEFLKKY